MNADSLYDFYLNKKAAEESARSVYDRIENSARPNLKKLSAASSKLGDAVTEENAAWAAYLAEADAA